MKKNWPEGNWVTFFSADWCGHCTDFKKTWNTFSEELSKNNENVGVINIDSKELESKNIKPEVFGFPTIRAYRDGKMISEFDNHRTVENLNKFVNTHFKKESNLSNSNNSKKQEGLQHGGYLSSAPYSVNVESSIPLTDQWSCPNDPAPTAKYNGGLYTGPPFDGPWGNIPVTQTASNVTHNNLNSAEPPPGAVNQYPGSNRLGNNYNAMPEVNWFQSPNQAKTNIQCTPSRKIQTGGKGRKYRKNKKLSKRNLNKKKKQNKRSFRNKNKKSKKQYGGSISYSPYSVNIETNVPLTQQWDSPNSEAPPPSYNGGLYTGPPFAGPWGNIPVTPTASNMTHNNLRSAEPPPGATQQYPGSNRQGNNFNAMPGVNWFKKQSQGPYRIQCTNSKQTGGNRKKRQNTKKKNKKSKK